MKNVLNNLKKFFKTDIKVINSYFLAVTILVILVSVGLTSYALFSYAKISNNVIEGKVGEMTRPNLDTSGASVPVLASNMIPVYYDGTTWRKADGTNSRETYKWYDYTNKMWANAVTVKSSTEFDDITENKSVSLSNTTIDSIPPTTFTSGGKGISNAKSYINITVNINSAGTFGFKATVSSESSYDKLTVTVSKNLSCIYFKITIINNIS